MNKIAIVLLVVSTFAAYSAAHVRPESKLYFSIPLGPAPAAPAPAPAPAAPAPAPAAPAPTTAAAGDSSDAGGSSDETTTAAGDTTAASGEATTAAAAGQMQLNIIPLGQLLGMLLTALFGSTLPSAAAPAPAPAAGTGAQLQVVPLFQALGTMFG